jgi:regulator of sirC expression with transglutaminase-like and TPR domain
MIVEEYLLRRAFREEIARPDADLNLARCALLIAAEEYPDLDIDGYLRQLDDLADGARERLRDGRVPDAVATLNRYLFRELEFGGNTQDYYDPANSYLNEVIDRRTGIPIALSVVYLEVGWRLGLPLAGVGLPGHFVVSCRGPEGTVYIDVYHGGALLDEAACARLMRRAVGDRLGFRREFLLPVSKRQILSRMLGNLKVVYQQQNDAGRALAVLDRMLELDPDSPAELRERGRLYEQYRALAQAQVDLRRMLRRQPRGPEADEAREELYRLERLWLN